VVLHQLPNPDAENKYVCPYIGQSG